jgi:hypothetical protein
MARRLFQHSDEEECWTIMNFAGRTLAMVVGVVGALLAFIITVINFFIKNISAGGLGNAHTPTGITMSLLALVGALIALPFPLTSAAAMLVAGVVMLFVAGGLGAIPLIVLAIAAVLAFLDRKKAA